MKSLLTCIFAALMAFTAFPAAFAQTPQGFSYQAIANNTNGTPVANGSVAVRISVLDNSATGTAVYTETHAKTTNAQGLFNLNIGQGTPTTGVFANINWAQNAKYVKVELDPAGGTNYTTVGTNQLMSVPYALYAEKSNTVDAANIIGSIELDNGSTGVLTSNTAYAFNSTQSGNQWWTQSLSGTPIKILGSKGNIGVLTSNTAYAFNSSQIGNQWWSQSLSGSNAQMLVSNGIIAVMTSNTAYVFNSNQIGNQWWSQSLSGTVKYFAIQGGKVLIVTTNTAYTFNINQSGNQWWSQSLSGTVLDYAK